MIQFCVLRHTSPENNAKQCGDLMWLSHHGRLGWKIPQFSMFLQSNLILFKEPESLSVSIVSCNLTKEIDLYSQTFFLYFLMGEIYLTFYTLFPFLYLKFRFFFDL